MLIVDDILLFPARGIFWILEEVYHAAREERAAEPDRIATELQHLYMLLQTGAISEQEFDAKERALLDRLDEIAGYKANVKTKEKRSPPEIKRA